LETEKLEPKRAALRMESEDPRDIFAKILSFRPKRTVLRSEKAEPTVIESRSEMCLLVAKTPIAAETVNPDPIRAKLLKDMVDPMCRNLRTDTFCPIFAKPLRERELEKLTYCSAENEPPTRAACLMLREDPIFDSSRMLILFTEPTLQIPRMETEDALL
jgi:hypothetical protein